MNKPLRTSLAYLRFTRGRLSQRAVSEATGIGQKTISALETGASKGIEFNTLVKLCTFFQCGPGDLLVVEEEQQEEPVSQELRQKAKELVAYGLKAAMQSPKSTPKQIWDEFDAVRSRVQKIAANRNSTSTKSVSAKKTKLTRSA